MPIPTSDDPRPVRLAGPPAILACAIIGSAVNGVLHAQASSSSTSASHTVGTATTTATFSISNEAVALNMVAHREYGLVHTSLVPLAAGVPQTSGVILKPTSTWKIALLDLGFDHDDPPADDRDGLVYIEANEVTPRAPKVTKTGSSKLEAVWSVTRLHELSGDPDAAGFPVEDFEVRYTATTGQTAGEDDDFARFELAVILAEDSDMTVYSMELRTAAPSVGTKTTQILAAPWYMGALVSQPLTNSLVAEIQKVSEVRVTDPVLGAYVPTHPGEMSMQWLAYYDEADPEGNLLFWGTRDPSANLVKPYLVYQEKNALGFGVKYFPPNNLDPLPPNLPDGKRSAAIPFDVVMSPLQGDWYDAADYYRDWAKSLPADESFLPQKVASDPGGDYSGYVREADAVGVVLPGPCASDEDLVDHQNFAHWSSEWDDFDGYFLDGGGTLQTVTRPWFWDWNSFKANFGEWFAPGTPPFRQEFTDNAPFDDVDRRWAPFFHPTDVCEGIESGFESSYVPEYLGLDVGSMYTVRDEFGVSAVAVETEKEQTNSCGITEPADWVRHSFCPGTPFLLDYASHVVDVFLAHNLDLDGLYLDEFHIGESLCYDADHAHALAGEVGGGTYFVNGKKILASQLKADLRAIEGKEDFFLWTEGPSEAYMRSILPGHDALTELTWSHFGGIGALDGDAVENVVQAAPLYQTVYNEYQRFSNRAPINGPETAFKFGDPAYMEEARRVFADNVYRGAEVPLGSRLTPTLFSTRANLYPLLDKLGQMVKSCLAVYVDPTAAGTVRFGKRLRDPKLDVAKACFADTCPGVGDTPLVQAAAFEAPGGGPAVLLLNWSHAEDGTYSTTAGMPGPGDQTQVGVELDMPGFDLDPLLGYELVQTVPADPTASFLIDWIGTGPGYVMLPLLPQLSARYFEIREVAPPQPAD